MEDRISKLADDILISVILSQLELKEVARTSILSRRWRYLSTYITSLNFDVCNLVDCRQHPKQDHLRFVNWVNQVVNLHRASFINDFRVRFDLDKTYSDDIDRWLNFTLSKKVKKVELDFYYAGSDPYTLNSYVFDRFSCGNNISCLTSLSLSRVNISGELLEQILSQCHLLEKLFVNQSHDVINLKVTSRSRRLKYVTICFCWYLKDVKVDVAHLVSFEFYYNNQAKLACSNFPSLNDLCLEIPNFWRSICYYPNLSKLSLTMEMVDGDQIIPYFPNVKHLELVVITVCDRRIFSSRCIAEACPLLHEFRLQVIWKCHEKYEIEQESESESEFESESESDREYSLEDVQHWLETTKGDEDGNDHIHRSTLPHLRKLEWIQGFNGYVGHVDVQYALALYIVKNAPALENFVYYSFDPKFYSGEYMEEMCPPRAKRRIWQLSMGFPSRINVVVL